MKKNILNILVIILFAGTSTCFAQTESTFNSKNGLSLNEYFESNVQYPVIAYYNGVQGQIHVSFNIDENGKIVNIKLERRVYEPMDIEAIRLVESTESNWTVNIENGEIHSEKKIAKIKFKIDEHPELKKLQKTYKKAIKYQKKEKYKKAAELFMQILNHNSNDYEVKYRLAQCYFKMNKKNDGCKLLINNKFSDAIKLKEDTCN